MPAKKEATTTAVVLSRPGYTGAGKMRLEDGTLIRSDAPTELPTDVANELLAAGRVRRWADAEASAGAESDATTDD